MIATNVEKRRFIHGVRACLKADVLELEDMREMIDIMSRACDRVLESADMPCWVLDDNIGLMTTVRKMRKIKEMRI